MPRDKLVDLELVARIESETLFGDILAQQAVGADNLPVLRSVKRGIEDEEVVADRIEPVRVTGFQLVDFRRAGSHFLVKDAVANLLRRGDLVQRRGKPDFERADPAERRRSSQRLAGWRGFGRHAHWRRVPVAFKQNAWHR